MDRPGFENSEKNTLVSRLNFWLQSRDQQFNYM